MTRLVAGERVWRGVRGEPIRWLRARAWGKRIELACWRFFTALSISDKAFFWRPPLPQHGITAWNLLGGSQLVINRLSTN